MRPGCSESCMNEDQIAQSIILAMGGREGAVYAETRSMAEHYFTRFCQVLVEMGDRGRCTKDFDSLKIDFDPGSLVFIYGESFPTHTEFSLVVPVDYPLAS